MNLFFLGLVVFVLGCFVGFFLSLVCLLWHTSTIEIRYKQKDTYCDVWSPQLPGASAGGSYLNPALVSFLRQHGKKLGVVLVEEPVR